MLSLERRFRDRRDAGQQLARALQVWAGADLLVLGLARGGVPVAAEVARALSAPLDVIVARKLGAPGSPELAIGAVTADGACYLNKHVLHDLHVDESYVAATLAREREEALRREARFRDGRWPEQATGKVVIVVDDGLATGATMRAAVRSVRVHAPAFVVVAAPVGAREACDEMRGEADEVVCLSEPEPFYAVGFYYETFDQTSDREVQELLAQRPRAA